VWGFFLVGRVVFGTRSQCYPPLGRSLLPPSCLCEPVSRLLLWNVHMDTLIFLAVRSGQDAYFLAGRKRPNMMSAIRPTHPFSTSEF